MGPAELVPAKLVPVLQFSGAVPKLEELEIQKTISHRNVSFRALA